ncbi:unnamed protein product [Urochloa humidicola]
MTPSVVILRMALHCAGCARRIRKTIKGLYPKTVREVWVWPETGHVTVAGLYLDAWELRRQLELTMGKRVDVISDGSKAEEPPQDNGRMVHLGPPQTGYAPYSYAHPYGYYYAAAAAAAAAAQYNYSYGYGARQYVPFNDDNPNGCCVMQ